MRSASCCRELIETLGTDGAARRDRRSLRRARRGARRAPRPTRRGHRRVPRGARARSTSTSPRSRASRRSTRRPARPRHCSTRPRTRSMRRAARAGAALRRHRRRVVRARTSRSRRRVLAQAARASIRSNIGAHKGLARALRDDEQWADARGRADARSSSRRSSRSSASRCCSRWPTSLERSSTTSTARSPRIAKCSRSTPHNRAALDALGRLYDRAGQWQPALDVLQRLLAEHRADRSQARATLLRAIGHVHLGARDAVKAEASFGEAIALDPDNAHAHEGMARVLLQQGKLVGGGREAAARGAARRAPRRHGAAASPTRRGCIAIGSDDNEQARACLAADPRDRSRATPTPSRRSPSCSTTRRSGRRCGRTSSSRPSAREPTRRCRPPRRLAILAKAARCALELGKFRTRDRALRPRDAQVDPEPDDAARARRGAVSQQGARGRGRRVPDGRDAARQEHRPRAAGRGVPPARRDPRRARQGAAGASASTRRCSISIRAIRRRSTRSPSSTSRAAGTTMRSRACGRAAALASPTERIRLLERIGNLYRDKLAESGARDVGVPRRARDRQDRPPRAPAHPRSADPRPGSGRPRSRRSIGSSSSRTIARGAARTSLASAEIRRTHLKDRRRRARAATRPRSTRCSRRTRCAGSTRERALDAFNALRELVARRREVPRADVSPHDQAAAEGRSGARRRCGTRSARSTGCASTIRRARSRRSSSRTRSIPRSRRTARASSPSSTRRPARSGPRRHPSAPRSSSRSIRRTPTRTARSRRTALAAGRTDEAWCVEPRARVPQAGRQGRAGALPPVPAARDAQGEGHPRRGRVGIRAPPRRGSRRSARSSR